MAASAADTNAFLNGWFAAREKVHTWQADFTQTRRIKTLTQPLIAQGHISFSAPNDFRWELGKPPQTVVVRHDDEMFVIYPLLKRAEHYAFGAASPRQWRDAMALLNAGFPKDRHEFESQFQLVSLNEDGGVWRVELRPQSAFARQWMPKLELELAQADFSLTGVALEFVDGSSMRTKFSNAVMNPALEKDLFQWKPPQGFQVTNPLSQ